MIQHHYKVYILQYGSTSKNITSNLAITYNGYSTMPSTGLTIYKYFATGSYTTSAILLEKGKSYKIKTSVSSANGLSGPENITISTITLKSSTDPSSTIAIGRMGGTVYAGTTNIGCAGNSTSRIISIGASGTTFAYATTPTSGFTAASDKRDKADFKTIDNSLNFINQLQPVTFVDNHREKYTSYDDENNKYFNEELYNNQTLKGNRRIAGFIAQDVYKSLIDIYNDDNYASVVDYSKYDDPDCDIDRYYMRYTQIIPFLTGAIQELTKKIETLENRIIELENKQS